MMGLTRFWLLSVSVKFFFDKIYNLNDRWLNLQRYP